MTLCGHFDYIILYTFVIFLDVLILFHYNEVSKASHQAVIDRPHFSGILRYYVPRLNGQNAISAGDFDIFRTNFCYFIIAVGQTDQILPTFM